MLAGCIGGVKQEGFYRCAGTTMPHDLSYALLYPDIAMLQNQFEEVYPSIPQYSIP